ncbi:TetR/AcrR family transcriptional regulator [Paraburkholderia caballeronis]|uniref:Transcriptional regulator, TetR family n=1 Tax=Paraburkholderia caballeronis TaxID=416943 RepID=A0A1H7G4D6_9BURK|nr:TetR/AcrR family transcriptional regulator [Paraburkholderia caballeronis]PXW24707.1 TetR family transcriptional regulator [Paraburkholderia caballeronis]PXX00437.1 TetR family transcriptional regulator [Paraburkholderia caballeronis]RAJ98500.1 TetR family transcriptional regulator [Paraburkholderia caballeronis]TDV16679.1 TetR family transcriptional regulator [Paraburkholderia caballeronis]TDV19075.1 TetR family transcriptional regulator [Paraburkholderia caballeronis]
MKKSRSEVAQTRKRIVEVASEEIRRNGIQATVLADVMAKAGLTHGGFYRHFESKDQLVAEACASGMAVILDAAAAAAESAAAEGDNKAAFRSIVERYLSAEHRDNPTGGCVLAGLGSELARADEPARAAASGAFSELVDVMAKRIRRRNPEAARSDAVFALSAMIGAITMSRVMTDPALSDSILQDVKRHLDAM